MNNSSVSKAQQQFLDGLEHRRKKIRFCQISILVIFIFVWEFTAKYGIIDPFIFSQPSRIVMSAIDLTVSGSIFVHIGVTLFETIVGFVLGTVIGIGIAILLWWNSFLNKVLEPYLVVLNSLPKTALAPIMIVWLGNNMSSIIATALLTSVIVTILSVFNGFVEVSPEKIKLIYTFGGTKKQVLSKVILPASVPAMINALKINVGLSFVGVIVGELLVSKAGLGYLIVYGSQVFKRVYIQIKLSYDNYKSSKIKGCKNYIAEIIYGTHIIKKEEYHILHKKWIILSYF